MARQKYEDVGDIPRAYQFVSDSQGVQAIKSYFKRNANARKCNAFFVTIKDGDYQSVYGIVGIIPHNDRPVFKVK